MKVFEQGVAGMSRTQKGAGNRPLGSHPFVGAMPDPNILRMAHGILNVRYRDSEQELEAAVRLMSTLLGPDRDVKKIAAEALEYARTHPESTYG